MCDTCGKLYPCDSMKQIFGGISLCTECVDNILLSYVSSNPIKMLCPFCCDKNSNKKCQYCDIQIIQEDIDHDN